MIWAASKEALSPRKEKKGGGQSEKDDDQDARHEARV